MNLRDLDGRGLEGCGQEPRQNSDAAAINLRSPLAAQRRCSLEVQRSQQFRQGLDIGSAALLWDGCLVIECLDLQGSEEVRETRVWVRSEEILLVSATAH